METKERKPDGKKDEEETLSVIDDPRNVVVILTTDVDVAMADMVGFPEVEAGVDVALAACTMKVSV